MTKHAGKDGHPTAEAETEIVVDLFSATRLPLPPDFRQAVVRLESAEILRKAASDIQSAAYDLAGEVNATILSEMILLAARIDHVSERLSERVPRN